MISDRINYFDKQEKLNISKKETRKGTNKFINSAKIDEFTNIENNLFTERNKSNECTEKSNEIKFSNEVLLTSKDRSSTNSSSCKESNISNNVTEINANCELHSMKRWNTAVNKICSLIKTTTNEEIISENSLKEESKAIIQNSFMTYIVKNVPFVEEKLKNATYLKEINSNSKEEKPTLLNDIEIFEYPCKQESKNSKDYKKFEKEIESKIDEPNQVNVLSDLNDLNMKKCSKNILKKNNCFQGKIKCHHTLKNKVKGKIISEVNLNYKQQKNKFHKQGNFCEIHKNNVSELPFHHLFPNKYCHSSKSITRHRLLKNQNNLKSYSDSCIKFTKKKTKSKSGSRKKKLGQWILMDNLFSKNGLMDTIKLFLETPLTKRLSKTKKEKLKHKEERKKNRERKIQSLKHINEKSISFENSVQYYKDSEQDLGQNGKFLEGNADKNYNGDIHENNIKIKYHNKRNSSLSISSQNKIGNEIQCCFADPELYYKDSELILKEGSSSVTLFKERKELRSSSESVSSYCTENKTSNEISHIPSETKQLTEITDTGLESPSQKAVSDESEMFICIKTIQNEYNDIKKKIENKNKSGYYKNEDNKKNDKIPKKNVPCQSTVTIISGFGSKSYSDITPLSEKINNKRLAVSKYKMKDAAVSAFIGREVVRKTKSTVDKAIMCTRSNYIKVSKNEIKSKIGDTLHNNQCDEINRMKKPAIMLSNYRNNENKNNNKWNNKETVYYKNIKRNKDCHGSVKGLEIISLKSSKDAYMSRRELENLKIKFNDNFKLLFKNENLKMNEPKSVWNSLKSNSQRFFKFIQQSGSFKICIGRQ